MISPQKKYILIGTAICIDGDMELNPIMLMISPNKDEVMAYQNSIKARQNMLGRIALRLDHKYRRFLECKQLKDEFQSKTKFMRELTSLEISIMLGRYRKENNVYRADFMAIKEMLCG